MAREFKRTDRIADSVQRLLASLIQLEIRDPRIGMVNINQVRVSKDLANATVFVTFIGRDGQKECEEAASVLNKAAGYLRSLLAKQLQTRTTPRLSFVFDEVSVKGQKLSNLIDQAISRDRDLKALSQDEDD